MAGSLPSKRAGEGADPVDARTYVVAVTAHSVVVGRLSPQNLGRAGDLIRMVPRGTDGGLAEWQSGTRAELLATYPDLLGDWAFDDADAAYRENPQNQIRFRRPDI